MRVAIVMVHADRRMEGARREFHLLRSLHARGAAFQVFRMHAGTDVEHETYLDGIIPASFFPADNPEQPPARRVSTTMLDSLREFRPTIVFYKGLNYEIAPFLQANLSSVPFGFIVGGDTKDRLRDEAALVLIEHTAQGETAFAAHHAAGRTMVLPKFFDADRCGDGAPYEVPRHDIVTVGAFHGPRKNQAALLPLSTRYKIAFVGGGPSLEAVKAMAPPKSRTRFYGHRRHDDVYGFVRDSRIMVHPALQDGLPRAVIEALACGRPVVAYRNVIPAGFVHGVHGLLVTPDTLIEEVERLLDDPDRVAAMGRAAFLYAHHEHGVVALDRAADRLIQMIQRALPG